MKKDKILVITVISALVMLSLAGITYALNDTLVQTFTEKNTLFNSAKTDYKKLVTLSQTNKSRIEGARSVMNKALDTIDSYMAIYEDKDNALTTKTAVLDDNTANMLLLRSRVEKAKTLDDLKKCLSDTKKEWELVKSDCKYIEARWKSDNVLDIYNKLIALTEDVSSLKDLNTTLKSSKETFNTEVYTPLTKSDTVIYTVSATGYADKLTNNITTLKEQKSTIDKYISSLNE